MRLCIIDHVHFNDTDYFKTLFSAMKKMLEFTLITW